MPNVMPIAPPPAAGSTGSFFRARLVQNLASAGNYVLNDTNVPGLGRLLPSQETIIHVNAPGSGVSGTVQITADGGTTWTQVATVTNGTIATSLPVDGTSVRIATAGGAVTVTLLVM